jgi:hypothetical protein
MLSAWASAGHSPPSGRDWLQVIRVADELTDLSQCPLPTDPGQGRRRRRGTFAQATRLAHRHHTSGLYVLSS